MLIILFIILLFLIILWTLLKTASIADQEIIRQSREYNRKK